MGLACMFLVMSLKKNLTCSWSAQYKLLRAFYLNLEIPKTSKSS